MKNAKLRLLIHSFASPRGRQAFVRSIVKEGRILDVGCGNNSPMLVKSFRPDLEYWGIDVTDYNNEFGKACADKYILCKPERFAESIGELPKQFDAVISSHNIEHCDYPAETIEAICNKLKVGGLLYFAFPSEASVSFPSRKGTLNFYDDSTHIYLPRFKEIVAQLKKSGLNIIYAAEKYQPLLMWMGGGIIEPVSRKKNVVLPGTWAYWGFEAKIWAVKNR